MALITTESTRIVIGCAIRVHRKLGPGLLESVYEAVLARMLEQRGLKVERQQVIAFDFQGMHFDEGLRVDLLINDCLVVELKSVENLAPVHAKQALTYLRLLDLRLGLLINFGAPKFEIKKYALSRIEDKASRPGGIVGAILALLPLLAPLRG